MLKKPTRLSVNINKIATLRNARGGDIPNVCLAAKYCQEFGAQGITVHPRPDERHIRYSDAKALREVVKTEYNIEGYPNRSFIDLVIECKPDQVTLVPDSPDVLTSNSGWDTISNYDFLKDVIKDLSENYAKEYQLNRQASVSPYVNASKVAMDNGLGVNAGHDLDLNNLEFFAKSVNGLLEVSIGHALISDAIYMGLENSVQRYLYQLELANKWKSRNS